jgi:serine/threonine-protein kinase
VQLSDKERAALGEANPVDPETYDEYLRGMFLINGPSIVDRKRGIEILEKIVENNPDNAAAYAGLAYGFAMLGHSPFPEGMYPASKLAPTRALELDDTLAEAHLSVGMLKLYYEWDFPAAEIAFQRAIDLDPNLAAAYLHYAFLLELYRDSERSLPLGDKGANLDPLSPLILANVGAQYWVAGEYEQALQLIEDTLAIDPTNAFARWVQALVYCDMGEFRRALEPAEIIREHPAWGFVYGVVLARSGRTAEAQEFLDQIEEIPRNVVALLTLNGTLNNNDEVFRWLEVARQVRLPWYPWFITWFPELAGARQDPRMLEYAVEINLEEYL